MDIFVEPVLPRPEVLVLGSSPVALALAELAGRFGFAVTACAPGNELAQFGPDQHVHDGYALPAGLATNRFIVVATQGKGDEVALRGALAADATFTAFVGSKKKMAALRVKLASDVPAAKLDAVQAPAGLDLGAITPDEIALSILAAMVRHRRMDQRSGYQGEGL